MKFLLRLRQNLLINVIHVGMAVGCALSLARGAVITNDVFARDTSGNPIYAQGGGVFKFNGIYYWYGVKYNGAVTYASDPAAGENGASSFAGFSCYSSTNLVDWKFEHLSSSGFPSGWIGRMGVCYNTNTLKYVLIAQGGGGELFATCSTPNGNFVYDHVQGSLTNVVNDGSGDQTIFLDTDGTPYLICSSVNGRSHLYVLPLRASDYLNVEAGTEIYHGNGREGNCMFKYNGKYYFCSSDLHGWNASHCYVLESTSTNIMGPYLPEYVMNRTDLDFCHVTQTGFFYTVAGTNGTTVLFVGDRWCDFGGNGIGYNQWSPLTFNGSTPTFQSVTTFNLDTAAGTWSVADGNNYILNPAFEADRVTQTSVAGWTSTGSGYGNVSTSHNPGSFHFHHFSASAYTATTDQLVTGLPNGTYTLSVWYKSSGGQTTARIFARNFGGAEMDANINTAQAAWTQISITNIPVINGQCDVGLYSLANANQSVDIDDWSLTIAGPALPTGLTATSGNAQVPLNWNAATGASAYNVKRATTVGGSYTVVATPTTNNYTDTTVVNGTTYYYVVSSTNYLGESPNSAQVSVVPSAGPIISAASVSPNPALPSQNVAITATVTAQANPIAAVTVDISAIGGVTNQNLISDGMGHYTNTITVGSASTVGAKTLIINASDNLNNIAAPYSFSLTIGSSVEIWDGGAGDDNWSSGANWDGDAAPSFGYSLIFAGLTRLTPVMDSANNIYSVTFNNTAGNFIVSGNGGALTLSGGVTNNSANAQTLNVPLVLSAPMTVNAASGDLAIGQTINNGGNLLTINNGGHNTTVGGAISGIGGLTSLGTGTNTLFGANTFFGDIAIASGALIIGGAGQLGGGSYPGAIANNGKFIYNSTAAQTLGGVISGTGGINQNGSGPLTLSAANLFTGPTLLASDTTLQLASPLALQSSALNYNNGTLIFSGITAATLAGLSGTNSEQILTLNNLASGAVALTAGGDNVTTNYAGNLNGSGSLIKNGSGTLTLSNANYTGATMINSGIFNITGGNFGSSGSLFIVGAATGSVSGGTMNASTVNIGTTGGQTGDAFAVNGNANATFATGVTIGSSGNTAGNLTVNTTGSVSLGSVVVQRNAGAVTVPTTTAGLIIANGTVSATNVTLAQSGVAGRGADLNINGGSLTIASSASTGKFTVNSTTGNGFVTMTGGALTYLGTDGLLASVGAGQSSVSIRGGTATLSGITLNSGNAAGVTSQLVVSNGGTLYLGAVGLVIKQPSGTVSASFGNGGATVGALADWSSIAPIALAGTTTFKAADASDISHNISLSGVLSGAGGLTKTGVGLLTLAGTNTYTGTTTVSAGNLSVNGSLATGSAVTVANGGVLSGTGTINGSTIIQNGGTFSPGNSIGTLTFSNSLALAAGSTSVFKISKAPLTNDVANVAGALTNGGALIVTNISISPLAAGDNFRLFNAASYNGTFANIVLPLLPAGLGWNTSALNTAGILSVVVTANPVIAAAAIAGNGFVFTGTGGVANVNFYLLSTTNLSDPVPNWMRLSTNQFDRNGNFNFTNTFNLDWSRGFYRLQLP